MFVLFFCLLWLGPAPDPAPRPAPGSALQDAPVSQAAIDGAIDRGTAFLLGLHAPDKKRGKKARSRTATERSGMRALVLYTLLECGVARDDPAVEELVTGLAAEPITQTYDAACVLLALSAHDPIGNRPWIDDLARALIGWQEEGGEWGYPGMILDLSNTQYAALGLWVAARDGVRIEPSVWERLARATLRYRGAEGGFSYGTGGVDATGSMTAAGVGTLALCEVHLRLANALDAELENELELAREGGLAWLDRHFSVETNPRSGAWLYYWLYGLERMGALAGRATTGEHDWYQEGARALVAWADEEGSWNGGTDLSETCFALLFLKRATASDSIPRTPREGERPDPAEAKAFRLGAEGTGPVRIWVESWNPRDVKRLEWPGERGLGPHVSRVEYFVDGELVGVVLGDPTQPVTRARLVLRWVPDATGEQHVTARAVVALPPGSAQGDSQGDARGEARLESDELLVDVTSALPAWLASEPTDLGPNLAPSFRPKASASSRLRGDDAFGKIEFGAELAVDGLPGTPWLAKLGDDDAALKVSYRKAEPVDAIRVRPGLWPARGLGYLSSPIEVEVVINGKRKHTVRLEEAGRPATVLLDAPVKIKRLDVRIRESRQGVHPALGVGEVELFLRGR